MTLPLQEFPLAMLIGIGATAVMDTWLVLLRHLGVPTLDAQLEVIEVMQDPELDEAVIAFANADFDQCEKSLLDLVQPGAPRHDHVDTWMVLFDLYRALDVPQKFEQLALAFVQKFGMSAPQWYSLPAKVSAFLNATQADTPVAHPVEDLAPDSEGQLEGWVAPTGIDTEAVANLRMACLQLPRPWTMSWHLVQDVTPEGAALLGHLMGQWAQDGQTLVWRGAEHLLHVGHRHAAQQRDALAQAFLVVGDLAAHGGFGDGRHLGLAAHGVGDFVHTLDVDERGVHVERDELEVLEVQRRREALNGEAGGKFGGGSHPGIIAGAGMTVPLRTWAVPAPGSSRESAPSDRRPPGPPPIAGRW